MVSCKNIYCISRLEPLLTLRATYNLTLQSLSEIQFVGTRQ